MSVGNAEDDYYAVYDRNKGGRLTETDVERCGSESTSIILTVVFKFRVGSRVAAATRSVDSCIENPGEGKSLLLTQISLGGLPEGFSSLPFLSTLARSRSTEFTGIKPLVHFSESISTRGTPTNRRKAAMAVTALRVQRLSWLDGLNPID